MSFEVLPREVHVYWPGCVILRPPDGAIRRASKYISIALAKKEEEPFRFGKDYDLLLLLPFCSLLLFLWMWPPKASELQTVHCIVGNVVDILHGCWAEDVHLCLAGFGTGGPLFGCFWTPSLLGRPWTVGPWLPGFGGLSSKYMWFTPFRFGSSALTILNSLDSL